MFAVPRLIGHRGAAAYAPENTLAGFREAKRRGATWVEFDVRLAADGALVVLHDDTLDRTTSGTGAVIARNAAALSALDNGSWFGPAFAGERVPTLAQTLAVLGELGLGANIEVKTAAAQAGPSAQALAHMLAAAWPAHLPTPLISSFEPLVLKALLEIAPGWPRGLLLDKIEGDWPGLLNHVGAATLNVNHKPLTRDGVAALRASGRPVLVYTCNDAARARDLLDWGVASVISDRPDLLPPG